MMPDVVLVAAENINVSSLVSYSIVKIYIKWIFILPVILHTRYLR